MSSYSLSVLKTAWRRVADAFQKRSAAVDSHVSSDAPVKISTEFLATTPAFLPLNRSKLEAALAAEERKYKSELLSTPRVLGDDEIPEWLLKAIQESEVKAQTKRPVVVLEEGRGVISIESKSRLGFVDKMPDDRSPERPQVISIDEVRARYTKKPAA